MSEIIFRLAKPCDAKQIANCHWHVRDRYRQGIFLSLGEGFLRAYYKIVLNDPWEVVVCAVNKEGKIVGFTSSTIDAEAQAKNLRNHRIILGLFAAKYLILNPHLIKEVWRRYRSLNPSNNVPSFIHTSGVRGEYWCWDKNDDSYQSVELSKIGDGILYDLGYKESFFEVDILNKAVYKYHIKINKAQPLEEMTLPDGRVRVLFKKELSPKK